MCMLSTTSNHSLRILFTLVSLHLLEVPVLMVPSPVHDGDDVFRRHGPSTCLKSMNFVCLLVG